MKYFILAPIAYVVLLLCTGDITLPDGPPWPQPGDFARTTPGGWYLLSYLFGL